MSFSLNACASSALALSYIPCGYPCAEGRRGSAPIMSGSTKEEPRLSGRTSSRRHQSMVNIQAEPQPTDGSLCLLNKPCCSRPSWGPLSPGVCVCVCVCVCECHFVCCLLRNPLLHGKMMGNTEYHAPLCHCRREQLWWWSPPHLAEESESSGRVLCRMLSFLQPMVLHLRTKHHFPPAIREVSHLLMLPWHCVRCSIPFFSCSPPFRKTPAPNHD